MPMDYHKWLFRKLEHEIKKANFRIIELRCQIDRKSENTELILQENDPFMYQWLQETSVLYNENCRLIEEITKIYDPLESMPSDEIKDHWEKNRLTISKFQNNQIELIEKFSACLKYLNEHEENYYKNKHNKE